MFQDVISVEFLNFTHLRVLDLSNNAIQFNKSSRWRPPFQLDVIHLYRCQLGPQFPRWLRSQKDFSSIDISENGILGTVPDWFWNLSGVVEHMDLSQNILSGKVPDLSSKVSLSALDLRYNGFSGLLPKTPSYLSSLILSNNSFEGSLTTICKSLEPNNLLRILDLSLNKLSGPLPVCLEYAGNLVVMRLGGNNLSGQIPSSIGNLIHLKVLNLASNAFSGKLPSFLKNLTSLVHIDLYGNMLSGEIPSWVGESLQNLLILSLGRNKFSGEIPLQLCQLKALLLLDLGWNSLSGAIPSCIDNLLTMANLDDPNSYIFSVGIDVMQTFNRRYGLNDTMPSLVLLVIDLSSNHLSGEIPAQLGKLAGLTYLNLSNNGLAGAIPSGIGDLTNLEALDLSRNKLSCALPSSLTGLPFLALFNVSYNNLSGEIPSEGQLATFDNSSYLSNDHLCGIPLSKRCKEGRDYNDSQCRSMNQQDPQRLLNRVKDQYFFLTFNVGMWMGFVTAIWVNLIALFVSESWRQAYSKSLDEVVERIYVGLGGREARRGSKLASRNRRST